MVEKNTLYKIMIVDDIPTNIKVLGETLRADHEITFARSGQKALEIIEENPPDLVLLDIMMPGIDGYEVCRRLKKDKRTRDIPIIFITAKGEDEDEAKGLELGAVDYIAKPFNPVVVKARINTHLELKQHRDNLEDLVEERTSQLIHSDRLATLGTISAAIAHEIMNPLFSISLNAELIQESFAGEKEGVVYSKIEKIIKNTRRISALVDGLRGYSRKSDIEKQNYILTEIIGEALNILNYRIANAGMTADTSGVPKDMTVYCDYQGLFQVFVNLITNAADASDTDEGGTIIVSSHREGNNAVICIRDNGPGMSEQMLNKIFDPFFTTKGRDQGTGLGLYIVSNIIEMHNGRISAISIEGTGTEFEIVLPMGE